MPSGYFSLLLIFRSGQSPRGCQSPAPMPHGAQGRCCYPGAGLSGPVACRLAPWCHSLPWPPSSTWGLPGAAGGCSLRRPGLGAPWCAPCPTETPAGSSVTHTHTLRDRRSPHPPRSQSAAAAGGPEAGVSADKGGLLYLISGRAPMREAAPTCQVRGLLTTRLSRQSLHRAAGQCRAVVG